MIVKFYICKHCGNIIAYVKNSGVNVVCCGEKMTEIIPNSQEASTEKHLPVITIDNGLVEVNIGSIDHPMTTEHYIEWVLLQTKKGNQRVCLTPTSTPKVSFKICKDDEVICAYAYCNLHGLWKKDC